MAYRFEASSLTGTPLGAIDRFASGIARTVSFGLSRPTTCSFGLALDSDMVDTLQRDPCRIRVYDTERSPSLVGHLDLIDDEEVGGEGGLGTVQFNASDQWWLLARRRIGKAKPGYVNGTALALVERGLIAKDILDEVNTDGETGLRSNASVVAAGATYVGPWSYKVAAEAIAEIAATIDGFEWVIEPMEYASGKVGDFKTYGVLGTYQENAGFEYGPNTRGNVKSYRSPRTRQTQANVAFSLPSGWPDNTTEPVTDQKDDASIAKWLKVEDVVTGDLTAQLRQQLCDEHVRVRNEPRKLWTFDPIMRMGDDDVRVPIFGVDYSVGDLVPLLIRTTVEGREVTRFDGVVRVYQVNVSIDAQGAVTSQTVVAGDA